MRISQQLRSAVASRSGLVSAQKSLSGKKLTHVEVGGSEVDLTFK